MSAQGQPSPRREELAEEPAEQFGHWDEVGEGESFVEEADHGEVRVRVVHRIDRLGTQRARIGSREEWC